jgi:hypothetical protein
MALVIAGTAFAVVSTFSGTGIDHIEVVTNTSPFSTNSLTYVNVSNATVTLSVPANGMVRTRFSAETLCGGETNSAATCTVRTLRTTGLVQSNPKSSTDFAFDSFPPNACCTDTTPEAHSMEWISDHLAEGTYTFKIQAAVVGTNNVSFTVDDWTFSAEVIPAVPS